MSITIAIANQVEESKSIPFYIYQSRNHIHEVAHLRGFLDEQCEGRISSTQYRTIYEALVMSRVCIT